ncbi:MAG: NAD-dependent epimerase/dehydratase family protein [Mariprofundales bacterium]
MTAIKNIFITGATSQIGIFLLKILVDNTDYHIYAVSRNPQPAQASVTWLQMDLEDWTQDDEVLDAQSDCLDQQDQQNKIEPIKFPNCDIWIHLALLSLINETLLRKAATAGVQRLLAFGTTSMFTKQQSHSAKEQGLVNELEATEKLIAQLAPTLAMPWTLFRPTMIYGCGLDKNVSFIRDKIKRFGFIPIINGGHGLRQPVHAEDLAIACLQALEQLETYNKSYNLSGGEILSYVDMVRRIFVSMNKKPRLLNVPLGLMKFVLRVAALIPSYRFLTPDMAERVNQDLVFPHDDAQKDFGYQPRGFLASDKTTSSNNG